MSISAEVDPGNKKVPRSVRYPRGRRKIDWFHLVVTRKKSGATHDNDVHDPALGFFSLVVSMEHGVRAGDAIGRRGSFWALALFSSGPGYWFGDGADGSGFGWRRGVDLGDGGVGGGSVAVAVARQGRGDDAG